MNYEIAVKNIREELEKYIINNNIKSLVLGISGGIDSTLVAALSKPVCDKLQIPLIGVSLPSKSNKDDEVKRAKLVGRVFCSSFREDDINESFIKLAYLVKHTPFEDERAIQNGNIKARIRMIYLYDVASCNKGLVLSTDNYTDIGGLKELWSVGSKFVQSS